MYYALAHLLFVYWVDKYNFVRRRSTNVSFDDKMNKTLEKVIHCCLPMFLLSLMIHNWKINWVLVALIIISFFNSNYLFLRGTRTKSTDKAESTLYSEAKKNFHASY